MSRQFWWYALIILMLFVFLIVFSLLSNSRFTDLQVSHKGVFVPTAYNPYAREYHPVEGFEERNPFKDAGPRLTVFAREGQQGDKMAFEASMVDLSPHKWQNKIQSLRLGPYTKATFFTSPQFRGDALVINNDQDVTYELVKFKGDDVKFRNRIQSFKLEVVMPYAIAYGGQNLGGISKIFHEKHSVLGSWERKIQSFKISPLTKVTLYTSPAFGGTSEVLTNATSEEQKVGYLGPKMDGKIRSLKVETLVPT
jgi:hypothetical protein